MGQVRHGSATTTHAVRAAIQRSQASLAQLGFNVGAELGQLAVILTAFLLIGYWFRDKSWCRAFIAIPASGAIGLMGTWWLVERLFL